MPIVIGGLPGTGKTTLARPPAARLGAVRLRIDTIEQAIVHPTPLGAGGAGPRHRVDELLSVAGGRVGDPHGGDAPAESVTSSAIHSSCSRVRASAGSATRPSLICARPGARACATR
ncbi:hypothetical protein [Streptomyces eurythermus]|uniref:AAA family ATPase n=1 Tax=Streptomyces eurythermus TaxID=42237 RepID=UPI0036D4065A